VASDRLPVILDFEQLSQVFGAKEHFCKKVKVFISKLKKIIRKTL